MNECAWVYVASNDGEQAKKDNADFVCTGSHDELTIQKAIDKCAEENKNLFLYDGKYFIEGFYDFGDGGPKTALRFPNLRREIRVCGETSRYSRNDGVRLFVTKETLDCIFVYRNRTYSCTLAPDAVWQEPTSYKKGNQ